MRRLKAFLIIFQFLFVIFFISEISFAQKTVSWEDKIIALTFKGLAKSFLLVSDIEKIKKSNTDKLKKMNESKFRTRYAEIYRVIDAGLPEPLKASYNLRGVLPKEEAISIIESLDKKKINQIINALPDQLIAGYFKEYLQKIRFADKPAGSLPGKTNILDEINKSWNKILSKVFVK